MQVGMPWEKFSCKEEGLYAIIPKYFMGQFSTILPMTKELYALVQAFKKWKHYFMSKDTIIHIDHQSLEYLQAENKLQQTRRYKWMGFFNSNFIYSSSIRRETQIGWKTCFQGNPHPRVQLWEL
jgi:hypothetical protein